MTTLGYVLVVVGLWSLAGLAGVVVLLARQGHRDGAWYLLGAVLGPLFIPIAAERARRDVQLDLPGGDDDGAGSGTTVVVGVDGSAESDQAVRDADLVFGRAGARIVLVTALDPDIAESAGDPRRREADDLLARRATWLAGGRGAVLRVGSGQPARVLLTVVSTEGADVLVVGRRGKGLSTRLLGSVAEQVTRQAGVPVLLAGPAPDVSPSRGS